MGMFDNVKCDREMPDGYRGYFQTKDFGCNLDQYEITEDGRLMFTARDNGWPVDASTEAVNFHGWLNFYTGSGNPNGKDWKWHEYMAKFTDGSLVEILTLEQYNDRK